ncbi:MAG TPA: conjugal transfer protein TraR [Ignavibacteria bacterium]|nr:conjugal transfer protein TraR [Ignavibacteria bacterium]HMR41327.1 conjugal transfer protein TraR [Ignavibacteria bacterium]
MAKTKTKSAAKKSVTKKSVLKPKSVTKKTASKKIKMTPKKKTEIVKKAVAKKTNNKPVSVKKTKVKKVVLKPAIKSPVKMKSVTLSVSSGTEAPEKKIKKFKPNKKTRYTKTELKHFRDIILKERKAIFESAKANMDALVDKESGEYKGDNLTYSSHMAEQGTDEMEREKNYLFVQRDEKYLGYLQDALTRIDQGTYGICVDCREEPKNLCRTCPLVAKERLELVPITQHCIECKNLRG